MPRHFTIYPAIAEAVAKHGLTVSALAKAAYVQRPNLSRYLSTGAGLSIEAVERVCRVVGVVFVVRDEPYSGCVVRDPI